MRHLHNMVPTVSSPPINDNILTPAQFGDSAMRPVQEVLSHELCEPTTTREAEPGVRVDLRTVLTAA